MNHLTWNQMPDCHSIPQAIVFMSFQGILESNEYFGLENMSDVEFQVFIQFTKQYQHDHRQ